MERQSNILLKLFFQNCLLWSHLQRNNYIIQTTQQGLTFMLSNLSKTHLLVLYLDYIHSSVSMLQPLQRVPPHDLHPAELHRGAAPQHPQVAGVQTRVECRQHEPGGEAGEHDGGGGLLGGRGDAAQARPRLHLLLHPHHQVSTAARIANTVGQYELTVTVR